MKFQKLIKFMGFTLVLFLLVWFGGCATNQQGAKQQLKSNSSAVLTHIRQQKKSLALIKSAMEKSQENFSSEQSKFPGKNLLAQTDSKTYQYVTKRNKAYAQFKGTQSALKDDQTTLTKIANQNYPELPKQAMSSLNQSLHLSALDQKTFVTFMDEMQGVERTYYGELSDNTTDSNTLNAQENRLNQYYGAIFQQIEIMVVNLNTAQNQAESVQSALK